MKRGSFFFNRAAADAAAASDAADGAVGDTTTIAAGEPLTPRPSRSDERLQRVRRMQMAQFMDQLRRTSLQQVGWHYRSSAARLSAAAPVVHRPCCIMIVLMLQLSSQCQMPVAFPVPAAACNALHAVFC